MSIAPGHLSDKTVAAFVAAVNSHDETAFYGLLTADATMSDDGSDRDLRDWAEREIFSSNGHMDVETESDGGRSLIVGYRNDTWGEMRTAWRFTVTADGSRIARFETGQA
ncbi:nuclear transport factor 2 family protein [Streptomyces bambusae]|uniref:nuclear transport factor 2 family protein n=1 Tax=Streptomyces bambusae TaxID=1550616 RepID=UPI001CFFCA60|nr:nuclear transport factor 2 family protein [Streptomyces bambusae]MCB5169814.1 nuclear transport factor 2 family protein [Streptomyces bambusae]